jgi:peptidoglycan/LPS O-acetylase OafA/YrhL
VGDRSNVWLNGLYESLILSLVFPIIIYLGAIGKIKHPLIEKCCIALGDISYPLYITHFPFILMFYAWVSNNKVPLELGVKVGIPLIIATIGIAYLALKLYDLPIRKWLTKRFMHQELATSKIKS